MNFESKKERNLSLQNNSTFPLCSPSFYPIMGLSKFLRFLLISATVLALCFSQGSCGRKLMAIEKEDSTGLLKDHTEGGRRMLIEVMDYSDPGANPRNARFTPPSRRL